MGYFSQVSAVGEFIRFQQRLDFGVPITNGQTVTQLLLLVDTHPLIKSFSAQGSADLA